MDSYYASTANERPSLSMLQSKEIADICIVGAGYTGLSSALHLALKGYSVIVLEAETIAFGASGRNGGHVGIGQRADQEYLETKFGDDAATLLWEMSLEAVATVKSLIEDHNIACDLKAGNIHLAHKPNLCKDLYEEMNFLQDRYNFSDMEYIPVDRLDEVVASDNFYGALWDKVSCHLHPLNFALGLADAALKAGVRIYENSRVTSYGGSPLLIKTANGEVSADEIVLACNGYIEKLEPRINGYIMPINNFVLATEPLDSASAHAIIPKDTSMADTRFVINYWKLSADNRLIFGGGENYRRAFPADIKSFVRKYMLQIYPQLIDTKIEFGWGGTLAITMNRLPHFGRLQDNIWHMHGYSGHGVPTATFAGKLVAEAISGKLERFDVMSNLDSTKFPGGTLLRWPGMVSAMLYYSLRDRC
ncbi:MAG: FAD-binding oxidoreductase [Porticoccaceae bacterium]|nr:FAD-binding oxidoreductase [Porticoccaceae bacterium]MDG1473929.1 FAD-binding oxidoreductase [Porticoccaceae bacterium]